MMLSKMFKSRTYDFVALDRDEYTEPFYKFLRSAGFYTTDYGFTEKFSDSFVNDVFEIRPYYWDDCQCGFDKRTEHWESQHKHSDDCYQTYYAKIKSLGDHEIEKLCKSMKLPYPNGSASHCTCPYDEEYDQWLRDNDHSESCPIVQPNFYYKPTGFKIDWYKYPLRGATANFNITLEEFELMLTNCLESMKCKEL